MSLEMVGFEQNKKGKYVIPSVVFSALGVINFTASLVEMADMEDWKYASIWYDNNTKEVRFRKEYLPCKNTKEFSNRGRSKQLFAKSFINKERIEAGDYECTYDVVSKEVITSIKVKGENIQ